MTIKQVVSFGLLILSCPWSARAAIGTETLPAGIRSPSVRIGNISGLDQNYTDKGSLAYSVDQHSIEFDAKRLSSIEPRVNELVRLFNDMGKYQLGSAMNLGTLKIDSKPNVQYTAPVMAYGINDRWTIGVGAPVIHYTNNISVSKTASNISTLRHLAEGFAGETGATQLIDGLNQLENTDLVQSFYSELRKKHYDALDNQDQTFLGDLMVASMYRLDSYGQIDSQVRVNLNLPTGPKFNPDNLAALNNFGYTYIEPQFIAAYPLATGWKVAGSLGVRYYLPDQITVRVPTDENDVLPDASQKESVRRMIGLKTSEVAQLSYAFSNAFSVFSSLEMTQKGEDQFDGGNGKRYDLLSKNTDTQAQLVSAGLAYSTVDSYLKSQKGIPAQISLQISDTIAGRNTERQLTEELSGTIFF